MKKIKDYLTKNVPDPGSGIRKNFIPEPDSGGKSTGSQIRICNTAAFNNETNLVFEL
jgi:hypothetical protein